MKYLIHIINDLEPDLEPNKCEIIIIWKKQLHLLRQDFRKQEH